MSNSGYDKDYSDETKSSIEYAFSTGEYPKDAIRFKDGKLCSMVRNILGQYQGYIYKKDLSLIKELDVSNCYIFDLSGIENISNLEILNASNNNIGDLTYLNSLHKLKELYLSNNLITDLSELQDISNLSILDIRKNSIEDLSDFKRFTNTVVYIDTCDLPYENNIDNYIFTDVNFVDGYLDLAIREDMDMLYNNLYKEDLVNVYSLNLADKNITDLTGIEDIANLLYLDLRGNNITDFSPLLKLNNLKYLYLGDTEIKDLQVQKSLYDKIDNVDFVRNNQIEESNNFKDWPSKTVNSNKILTIKFNNKIDFKYVNIYVSYDENCSMLVDNLTVKVDETNLKNILVLAPPNGYDQGEYYLFIDILKSDGSLKKTSRLRFTVN